MADKSNDITDEVFYLGGIIGSGVLVSWRNQDLYENFMRIEHFVLL